MTEPDNYRPPRQNGKTPDTAADRRFGTGVLVLVVLALAWPWYAWFVEDLLDRRRLALEAAQMEAALAEQAEQARQASQQARQGRLARERERRVAAVQLAGVSDAADAPVVIARLGEASLEEAGETLCRQAGEWLRRPTSGIRLRVQRHNGSRPATDVGELRCP
ncbi:MAG: hypothetical protein KF823_10070 [Xanthomonadales bacterium]|nr:hypothetical protein [Xanthomonadales bacterium]